MEKLYYIFTIDKSLEGGHSIVYATGLDGEKVLADEGTKAWWEAMNRDHYNVEFKSEPY